MATLRVLSAQPSTHGDVMRRFTSAVGFAALAILVFAGCSSNDDSSNTTDSATTATPQAGEGVARDLPKFSSVSVNRGVAVRVAVEAGAPQNIEVTKAADESVTTKVKDGTLVISRTSGTSEVGVIDVRVSSSNIKDLAARGGSTLNAAGKIDSYELRASQGSSADATALQAKNITVTASESANVAVYAVKSVTGTATEGASVTVRGNPKTTKVKTSRGATVTSD